MSVQNVKSGLKECETLFNALVGIGRDKVQSQNGRFKQLKAKLPQLKKDIPQYKSLGLIKVDNAKLQKMDEFIIYVDKANVVIKPATECLGASFKPKSKRESTIVNSLYKSTKDEYKAYSEVNDLITVLLRNKESMCIGIAHTFYEEIKKVQKKRRDAKIRQSEVAPHLAKPIKNGAVYYVKTMSFTAFLRKSGIKAPSKIKLNGNNKSNKTNKIVDLKNREIDVLHFIEMSDKLNMFVAFQVIQYLLKTREKMENLEFARVRDLEKRLFSKK